MSEPATTATVLDNGRVVKTKLLRTIAAQDRRRQREQRREERRRQRRLRRGEQHRDASPRPAGAGMDNRSDPTSEAQ